MVFMGMDTLVDGVTKQFFFNSQNSKTTTLI